VIGADSRLPVSDALVELWSPSGLLAHGRADEAGRFALAPAADLGTLALLVRRIGFAPARVAPVRPGVAIEVTLRELPVPLPDVYVASCPHPDDPEARRTWTEARSHYTLVPDSVVVWVNTAR